MFKKIISTLFILSLSYGNANSFSHDKIIKDLNNAKDQLSNQDKSKIIQPKNKTIETKKQLPKNDSNLQNQQIKKTEEIKDKNSKELNKDKATQKKQSNPESNKKKSLAKCQNGVLQNCFGFMSNFTVSDEELKKRFPNLYKKKKRKGWKLKFDYVGDFGETPNMADGSGKTTIKRGGISYLDYEGEHKNNSFEGKGKLTIVYEDESVMEYKGQFKNDKFEGEGILLNYQSGSRMVNGESIKSILRAIKGSWKNNKLNGNAVIHASGGRVNKEIFRSRIYKYEGEVKDYKFSGKGKFTAFGSCPGRCPDFYKYLDFAKMTSKYMTVTKSYDGDWKSFKPHGRGVYTSGDYNYEPTIWLQGQPKPKPKRLKTGFTKYSGTWLNGRPDGKGQHIYKNGNIYNGDYRSGRPDGQGEMKYLNGDVYNGSWRNGIRSGTGVLLRKDGTKFSGEFVDNKPAQ